jgi:prophage regulatory protein
MESEVKQLPQALNTDGTDADQSLPLPGTEAYESLPQFPKRSALPFRRTIRRKELRQIVPLAETTIYEMERRGEFPRRFNLTPRCVVWDLAEVEAWCWRSSRTDPPGSRNTDPPPGYPKVPASVDSV